jgi:CBS domain-containing protein
VNSRTERPPRSDTSNMPKQSSKKAAKTSAQPPRKRVEEVASDQPKPLQEKSSVKEAGEKMRSLKTDKFPVASGDRLVGTVIDKYSDRKVASFGHDPATTPVGAIMVKQTYYCSEHESVDEAREIMRKHRLRQLPVVDANLRIVGIVTLEDLVLGKRPRTKK